jgi:peptidoglycan biosynthesis protein MviN/MurJ (putative lipid II flippase)
MSPTRTRKPVVRSRARSEIVVAVAVGLAIVLGTVLLIWLLRPGAPGQHGSGGLFSRQPRATLFVVITLAVLGGAIWWVLRHRIRRVSRGLAIVLCCVVVLGGAAVVASLWPGGVIHHWQSQPSVNQSPPPTPPPTPTTAKRATPTTKAG